MSLVRGFDGSWCCSSRVAWFMQLHLARVKLMGNRFSNKDLVYELCIAIFEEGTQLLCIESTRFWDLIYCIEQQRLAASSHDFITCFSFCLFGISLSLGKILQRGTFTEVHLGGLA